VKETSKLLLEIKKLEIETCSGIVFAEKLERICGAGLHQMPLILLVTFCAAGLLNTGIVVRRFTATRNNYHCYRPVWLHANDIKLL